MLIKYLGAGPAGRHLGIIEASDTLESQSLDELCTLSEILEKKGGFP